VVYVVKRLALGVILITLAIGILLFSDWNRRSDSRQAIPRIAILQHASQPVLDEGVHGMLLGLAEGGFKEGETVAIQRFNAENDTPTENAIAREVTDGRFDLILTASTLSLQAVAGANRAGQTNHVFGLVLDPFSAGVGISREDPLHHPKHLVGYGSMQPVAEAFRLAKQLLPSLTTVGVVWNPAESNSQASTRRAREAAPQFGIRLLEATVDNSSGVVEAAGSLISRGVQALWVGGDVTVLVALDGVISAAKKGGIPVFTNIPPSAQRGALFDFGANHEEIGRLTGSWRRTSSMAPIRPPFPSKMSCRKCSSSIQARSPACESRGGFPRTFGAGPMRSWRARRSRKQHARSGRLRLAGCIRSASPILDLIPAWIPACRA